MGPRTRFRFAALRGVVGAVLVGACWQPSGTGVAVDIGTPDVEVGLDFEPLEPGGDIPLETFGQGGTHASLAIRTYGFGNRAWVSVTLRNLDDGESEVSTPETVQPSLLICRKGPCDLVPLIVMTGGLADPEDKDGLHVEVIATATGESGATAEATVDGYLRAR